jgi:hypothetical protein
MTYKKSLKLRLNQLIQREGYLWLEELDLLCKKWRYKLATAERRLRPSESPNVEPIVHHGANIGFKSRGYEVSEATFQNRGVRENLIMEQTDIFDYCG